MPRVVHFEFPADDYSGKLEEALRLGGGNGIPLPENEVDIGYAGNSANL